MSLFSEVAEEHPLLCVVDDAQWLDQASALTLAFVSRRLLAEPIGIVFAAREPGEQFQHLSALDVQGLATGDARALLGSVVPFKLDVQVRDRIVAETRGNPLALLELPHGLTAFADRARVELVATGEKVRKRTVETRDELTAQEEHIAVLARDGLSSREIAARVFLSPRTVEWHLGHVFSKLGIRSRRQLSSALPSSESEPAPG